MCPSPSRSFRSQEESLPPPPSGNQPGNVPVNYPPPLLVLVYRFFRTGITRSSGPYGADDRGQKGGGVLPGRAEGDRGAPQSSVFSEDLTR